MTPQWSTIQKRWFTGLTLGLLGTLWIFSGNGIFTLGFLLTTVIRPVPPSLPRSLPSSLPPTPSYPRSPSTLLLNRIWLSHEKLISVLVSYCITIDLPLLISDYLPAGVLSNGWEHWCAASEENRWIFMSSVIYCWFRYVNSTGMLRPTYHDAHESIRNTFHQISLFTCHIKHTTQEL